MGHKETKPDFATIQSTTSKHLWIDAEGGLHSKRFDDFYYYRVIICVLLQWVQSHNLTIIYGCNLDSIPSRSRPDASGSGRDTIIQFRPNQYISFNYRNTNNFLTVAPYLKI